MKQRELVLESNIKDQSRLAAVISHELAHCVRGHVEITKVSQAVGGVAGFILDVAAAVVTDSSMMQAN